MKRLNLPGIALALVFIFAFSGHAAAQDRKLLKTTLDNGLVVILEEDRSAPVVAFQMWVRVGSADETDDEAGTAHVFEHMLFKGTEKRKVGEIAAEVEAAGGYINAYTSYDTTVYHLAVASRYFSKGLDIISDAVQNSSFDPAELEKEKGVVVEELRMNEDSPERRLYKALLGTAYRTHPYGRPVIGHEETVRALTRERMVAFFEKWYVPSNMALVVAGDFDAKEALASVREAFGGMRKADAPQRSRTPEGVQTDTRLLITPLGITQARLSLGFHIPELRHEDTYALDVLADILGQGVSSRLYRALKSDTNLAYSVSAYAMTPRDPGLFIITASLKTGNTEGAVERIFVELERLRSEGPAPDEIKKAKLSLESSFVYDRETMEGKADQLGYYETVSGDLSFEKRYIEGVNNVSADDIRKAVSDYLYPENMSVAVLVPDSEKDVVTAAGITGAARKKGAAKEEITRVRLENGITVIVKQDRSNPVVALYATVPGGLRHETPAINGIANFTAGMLTRGTARLTREELAREVEGMAGSIGGFSGRNSMGVSSRFLARDFSRGLDLTADVILNPVFPEAEVEKLRADIIAAIKREEDYLAEHTFKLLHRTLFKTHPYGMPTNGTVESVTGITRDDIEGFYRGHFAPEGMIVSIVGDVDPDYAVERVKKTLGAFRRAPAAGFKEPLPEERPREIRRAQDSKDKTQAHIAIGFMGTTVASRDNLAMSVLTEILSSQGGRLFVELRDRLGLAYSVSAISRPGVDPGLFAVYIATAPGKKDEAINGMIAELGRVLVEPVTDEELSRAKSALIGGYELGLQDVMSQASDMAINELLGLGYDHFRRYAAWIEGVDKADILDAARRYITLDAYAVSIVGP